MFASSAPMAVKLVSRNNLALKVISLRDREHTDEELAELADCLLAHPDVVAHVWLGGNRLTDETGVKLARYIAASSTVESLNLGNNQLGSATYLALAAALRVNSSLRGLYLFNNEAVDRTRIDAAFVEALQLNPDRPAESEWGLYLDETDVNDFERLRAAVDHPSLQLLLVWMC